MQVKHITYCLSTFVREIGLGEEGKWRTHYGGPNCQIRKATTTRLSQQKARKVAKVTFTLRQS